MDAITLIPQLFYDLIGRIVPGATLLICAFLIFQGPEDAVRLLTTWSNQAIEPGTTAYKDLPTSLIVLGNILASYVVGALLGSVWYVVSSIVLGKKDKNRIQEAFKTKPAQLKQIELENKQYLNEVAFIYDYIHLIYPKAGARMAKLRAEQLMCGSISVGAIINGLLYALYPSKRYYGRYLLMIEVIFALMALTGVLLARHLEGRSGNAMINYWLLGSSGLAEGQQPDDNKRAKGS